MGRIVYTFSVQENSATAYQMAKWKREGLVISHVIQKCIETHGFDVIQLERAVDHMEKELKRYHQILKWLGVGVDEFDFNTFDGRLHPNFPCPSRSTLQRIVDESTSHLTIDMIKRT